MNDLIIIGLLAAILAVQLGRWMYDDWFTWQGFWLRLRRRVFGR